MRALALALFLAGCKPSAPAPAIDPAGVPGTVPRRALPAPDAGAPAAPDGGDATACLDRELQRRGLNEFGDPPDTVYAGGTPLFDEATGKRRERAEYVRSRHPEIAKACPAH